MLDSPFNSGLFDTMAQTDAAGFVLAGGLSSRMGTDKALVDFAGLPLVAHAVSLLREAGLMACIAGARSALAEFAPVVEDPQPGMGPLEGICAALASTPANWAVFVPVDLPLLPASLVVFMLHHACTTSAAVTLCSVNGFVESFPVVLRRETLPLLKVELESGRGGCYSAFKTAAASMGGHVSVLPVEYLVQCGHASHADGLPAVRWFMNVNDREELRRAEILSLSSGHRPPVA
jgi:molybdopterin-guanine dinucleotide biosynthesis protein A